MCYVKDIKLFLPGCNLRTKVNVIKVVLKIYAFYISIDFSRFVLHKTFFLPYFVNHIHLFDNIGANLEIH